MYPAKDARELAILMRISRDLDVVGDVTATVDNPSELLAWALSLASPDIRARRAVDSGHRYLEVSARRNRAPVRGQVTAVLDCEHHLDYWEAAGLTSLEPGGLRDLTVVVLSSAWEQMPLTPPTDEPPVTPESPSPN